MSDWDGKRVWITGHTGFKGSILSHWLIESGAEVFGYALMPSTSPDLYSELHLAERMYSRIADIRHADQVRQDLRRCRPEVVFHLAAQPLVGTSWESPATTFETNIQGTVNVLDAIWHVSSVRACVMVTTDKCYENSGTAGAFRETDRLGGNDPYSASKAAAELVIASYRKCFFRSPGNARIASARAGNVIGGGDWSRGRLLPDCIRHLDRGEPVVLRNPRATRPWQHVLEPLSGYLMRLGELLLGSRGDRFASAWNFGPAAAEDWTVRAIAELAIRCWGSGRLIVESDRRGYAEANDLRLDSGRARAELNWTPRWTTAEAVARTINWHRARNAGADMMAYTSREIAEYAEDSQPELAKLLA